MGGSFSDMTGIKRTSNTKEQNTKNNNSYSNMSSENDNANTMPSSSKKSQIIIKTPQEKCTDISNELDCLEKEINSFVGARNDKIYLKLEELLTRCLLKLDEIDRSDEKVNDQRKTLINYTHKLCDKLEKLGDVSKDNSYNNYKNHQSEEQNNESYNL